MQREALGGSRSEALEFLARWLLEKTLNEPHEVAQKALDLDPSNQDEASYYQAMKAAGEAASEAGGHGRGART